MLPRGAASLKIAVPTPTQEDDPYEARKPGSLPEDLPDGVEIPEELQRSLIDGRDLILNRKYDEAITTFQDATDLHKDSAIGPIGMMLVYQSLMLENFDLAHEKEFDKVASEAKKRIKKSLAKDGNEAWDYLLSGAHHGLVGLHEMRKKKFIGSISEVWDAVRSLRASKKQTT